MSARGRGADAWVPEPGAGLVDSRRDMELQLVGSAFDAVVFGGFQEGIDCTASRFA